MRHIGDILGVTSTNSVEELNDKSRLEEVISDLS